MGELAAALVASLLTIAGTQVQEYRRDRRRRVTLASAMLSDLAALDATVRLSYQDPQWTFSSAAFASLASIDRALDLFEPATVAAILDLNSALGGARDTLSEMAEGRAEFDSWNRAVIRLRLIACVQRAIALKLFLEAEGGSLPSRTEVEPPDSSDFQVFGGSTPPSLPPSPFSPTAP